MTNKQKTCSNCILDSTVPYIQFDEEGVCNYCQLHDRLEKKFPLGELGQQNLKKLVDRIKKEAKNKKYDCVVGVSGGRDSSFCLYMAKKLGLRPLAVHYDSAWSSDTAINNIKKIVAKLGVDLKIITYDTEEYKDLQISFLKASVSDIDAPDDLAIITNLYRAAAEEGIEYIINGHSFRTEGNTPIGWSYMDGRYVRSVHKRFGKTKLKNFKVLSVFDLLYYIFIKKIKVIYLPEYIEYNRDEVGEILKRELDWDDSGGHHFECKYIHFITYILREKFNIDKRKVEYSALIRSNQMTRDHALKKIKENPRPENKKLVEYCIKRLGLTDEELNEILSTEHKTFLDYPTYLPIIKLFRLPIKITCKVGLLPMSIEKYVDFKNLQNK